GQHWSARVPVLRRSYGFGARYDDRPVHDDDRRALHERSSVRESKLRTGESWTARLLHAHHHHDDRTHDDDDVIDAGRDHHDRRDNDRRGYHDRYRDDDCVPRRHHDDECRGEDFASEDHQAEERRP